MRLRWIAALALVPVLVAVLGAAARSTPERSAGHFTDEHGRALVLRGFNSAGTAKKSPDGFFHLTEADIDRESADMGTNFVRLLISWRAVEPEPGRYDTDYLDGLAERIGWYADRGYHVMLDMHQDLYSADIGPSVREMGGNGAPAWAVRTDGLRVSPPAPMWELHYLDPAVMRAFDHLFDTTGSSSDLIERYAGAWGAVAAHLGGSRGLLGYDLMNEPYGGILQGPQFEDGPLMRLYKQSLAAIREHDADSWVCLTSQAMGVNWGTPSAVRPLPDPREGEARIAYCPHLYPIMIDLGEGYAPGASRAQVDVSLRVWTSNALRTARALGDVPVVLGEFGLDTTPQWAPEYIQAVDDLVGRHLDGFAYWSRDDGSWGPYDEGGARNLVTQLDRPYPRAIPGDPVDWRARPGELTVRFRPDPAITAPLEVYLPARSFPAGPDVLSVEGADIAGWDPARRILDLTPHTRPEGAVLDVRIGAGS